MSVGLPCLSSGKVTNQAGSFWNSELTTNPRNQHPMLFRTCLYTLSDTPVSLAPTSSYVRLCTGHVRLRLGCLANAYELV